MNIILDRRLTIPLYRQIMNQIIEQISKGEILENSRLPSERGLASQLGVNRSTIVRAYDELFAEGFVERRPNSGTYALREKNHALTHHLYSQMKYSLNNEKDENFATYKKQLLELVNSQDIEVIDVYTGELPYKLLPNTSLPNFHWQDFLKEKQIPLGFLPLRQAIKTLVERMYQYNPRTEELMLTAGGLQSLLLIIQALLKPGDTVVIEKPSFFNGLKIFQLMSIDVIEISVDNNGLSTLELEELLKRKKVQLVLTNPNFQNPTGTTMSRDRRYRLIKLCQMYQIPIIEDDVFGQLSYNVPNKIPLLKELAPSSVIYIGSLSKILGNKIQLGWIDAPEIVLKELIRLRDDFESELSIFPQMLAHQALTNKSFTNQLDFLQAQLNLKRRYFIDEMNLYLKHKFTYNFPNGGYYAWFSFKEKILTEKDWQLFLKYKIAIFPSFFITRDFQSFRVNFSRLEQKDIDEFIRRLRMIYIDLV